MNDDPDAFPLDEAAIQLIGEMQREAMCRINAVLAYFIRVHNLKGNWMLAPNGRELVRQTEQLAKQEVR